VVPAGFSSDGVVAAGSSSATNTTSTTATGSSAGETTTAEATVTAGGGIGTTTLLVAGGVVAAGAVGAVALAGGEDDAGSGDTGSDTGSDVDSDGLGTGDLAFRLRWSNSTDLDLHVIEPSGEHIYFAHRTSATGGQLDVDSNSGCSGTSSSPVENVYWPTGRAPRGNYEYYVDHWCGSSASYTVQVLRGGTVVNSQSGSLSSGSRTYSYRY
jgi:hypothetical protein